MRRAPLAGLAFLVLGGQAAADTPATTQWVLATARATGRGGEEYVSSLRIANPSARAANVDLTYLAQSPFDASFTASGDNGAPPTVRVTVGPGETLAIEDVLGTTFAGKAAPFGIPAGGIRVDSDVPVSVLSRTFVANARSASGVPGTFGFSIPAQTAGQAVSAGETAWLTFVSSSASASSGFRTNLIFLNTGSAATVASVALVRADGSVAGSRDYTFGRASAAQQTDLGGSFVPGETGTNLKAVVSVKSGGPLAIGASLIDNAISSIAYLPPVKADVPDDGAYGWVVSRGDPALASAGRLDLQDGAPNFMSGLVVVECAAGVFVYSFLASGPGSGVASPNTVFAARPEGGWSLEGASDEFGSWSGAILPRVDGSLYGELRFTPPATARCTGVTTDYEFTGTRAFGFGGTP